MSQDIFSSIDPAISGTTLATVLNDFKDALVSGMSGTSRPTELDAGGMWVDMTNDPTSWTFKIYTGSVDITLFTLDLSNSIAGVSIATDAFSISEIADDTSGAILELVKRRIASSGQVNTSDVVGEIRVVGRTDSSTDPVVAKLIWTAGENQTTTAFGGTLSIWSTAVGSATITEHLKLAAGIIESLVGHKINSLRYVSQNQASTATINQLDVSKVAVEFTGSTATELRGLDSTDATRVVVLHNRMTSGAVTLKHENSSATANDRMKFPDSTDVTIQPQGSASLYYSTADSRWKLLSQSSIFQGYTVDTVLPGGTWTAPSTVTKVRLTARRRPTDPRRMWSGQNAVFMRDKKGVTYAWGANSNGQLGLGDVTPRSSPVAVLGGLLFSKIISIPSAGTSFGITGNGTAYAWGVNGTYNLGVGDNTVRSSPVAVLGGLTFKDIVCDGVATFGITTSNALYAWGINVGFQLGVGDSTSRSSPVAVLGGLSFVKVLAVNPTGLETSVIGLTTTGALYGWGYNANGQLGVGDVNYRSSPVAVLGGLTFKDIAVNSVGSFFGITNSGVAYAWGINTNGQLGTGDVTPRSSPVAVLGGLTFSKIFSANFSSFALTSAGALYAWGLNSSGQLGVGNTTPRSSPVAVVGGLTFSRVYTNTAVASVFAMTATGLLYGWGNNSNGQLGVGDVTFRSSPVAVLGGFNFSEVALGDSRNMVAATISGAIYSWGLNGNGQLGLGDVTYRSSPVAVLGGLKLDPPAPLTSQYDHTVVGGNSYTFTAGAEKCSFGTLNIMDNAEYVEVEYLS